VIDLMVIDGLLGHSGSVMVNRRVIFARGGRECKMPQRQGFLFKQSLTINH
jgi:hypothetical protein